jgi:hypothetical protein
VAGSVSKLLLTPGIQHLIAGLAIIGALAGLAAVGVIGGAPATSGILGVGGVLLGSSAVATGAAAGANARGGG